MSTTPAHTKQTPLLQHLRGSLLGTAVGDSIGLPAEALSRNTIRRRWKGRWSQGFILKYGMVSDDTEHTVMLARALITHPADPRAFQRRFARSLRWWLLGIPAGIGKATLTAIIKLWLGFPPRKSGTWSAGNGPAMRIAPIGIFFAHDENTLRQYVHASTTLTHSDPKAETGTLAIALTAAHITRHAAGHETTPLPPPETLAAIAPHDNDWQTLITTLQTSLAQHHTPGQYAVTLGLTKRITGYIYHTVPVVLYTLYHHNGHFKQGIETLLNLGGDTDTTAAIYGSLAGITGHIPRDWADNIKDYPWSPRYLEKHALCLAEAHTANTPVKPPPFPWYSIPFRNALFLLIVILHCLRRIIPC